jgi:hypothetical protein
VAKARRKAFDSLVVLISWSLWLERNARIFRGTAEPVPRIIDSILAKGELWCSAKLVARSDWFVL